MTIISNGHLWKYSDFLENSKSLNNAFGKDVIKSFVKLKNSEIKDFKRKETFNKRRPVTIWEKNNTLDC